MGTDTPLAVLSERPKLLFNYFKQLFAQVTNPPIDPLREGLVMSLMSFAGKQRNLLAETPEHCRQLKLPHPILTNEDIERLRTARREDFRVATLPAVFSTAEADPARAPLQGDRQADRCGRAGDWRRGVAVDPQRPRHLAQAGPDPQPAGHRRAAPRLVAAAAARPGGHRRRKRRAARGDALLLALRLRRQRHQSVSGLRGHSETARRRRSAGRRAHRPACRSVHHGRQEGNPQNHLEDGHFDAPQLPRAPSSSRPWGSAAS